MPDKRIVPVILKGGGIFLLKVLQNCITLGLAVKNLEKSIEFCLERGIM